MILATTKVEDFDRFVTIFSTKGAEKRRQHGSKGSRVFRDPNENDRVWAIFDWDAEGWQSFASDPRSPRSCRRQGTRAGRRCWSSAASTTPSALPCGSPERGALDLEAAACEVASAGQCVRRRPRDTSHQSSRQTPPCCPSIRNVS